MSCSLSKNLSKMGSIWTHVVCSSKKYWVNDDAVETCGDRIIAWSAVYSLYPTLTSHFKQNCRLSIYVAGSEKIIPKNASVELSHGKVLLYGTYDLYTKSQETKHYAASLCLSSSRNLFFLTMNWIKTYF